MKQTTAALYTPQEVLSSRHMPTWCLLAFSAGAVNAGAFLAVQRFVSHLTGSATRIGIDVGAWSLMGEYTLVLASFVAGAAGSSLAIDGRLHAGRRPWYSLPFAAVVLVLTLVAAAGHAGLFGPFGETVETRGDFVFLCLLSFAMGLLNAAVAMCTSMVVRATHMTGPATDLGIALGSLLFASGDARDAALRSIRLRGAKLVSFIAGAAVMARLAGLTGFLAFLFPAALTLVAALNLAPSRAPAVDARLPIGQPSRG